MDKECTQDFSSLSEEERNTFVKVFNKCLTCEVNTKCNFLSNTEFKIWVTRTCDNSVSICREDTFAEDEANAFAKMINERLANDEDCKKHLPLNSQNLFTSLLDGVILCKLVNCAVPTTIDERVINKKDDMNDLDKEDNINLAISSSKAIGCQLNDVNTSTVINQKKPAILNYLWQVLKFVALNKVNLEATPQLLNLKVGDETHNDVMRIIPEDMLLRWFNYHLTNAGHENHIFNYTDDVKDSVKYTLLLNQLNAECDKAALDETDHVKRGQLVLDNAAKLNVSKIIEAEDINNGNGKLNLLFTSAIFHACHGLKEAEKYESAELKKDDVEGTREERAFRMWINSLGIEDTFVHNLYDDCESGLLLIKVFDRISPGSVDWKHVDKKPSNKFKKMANCNECIAAAKKCGLRVVGVGGSDIHEGNKKNILAIVWQMMRHHTLAVLGNKTEEDILHWANELVGEEPKITSFASKELRNSMFFINLMAKMESRAINWDIVMKDDTEEAVENNANYAINIARKLGATIFLVWEDIKEVKSKMLMTFVAGLYDVYQLESKLKLAKNMGK